jgi:hypothetical protein
MAGHRTNIQPACVLPYVVALISHAQLETLCHAIERQLEELARQYCQGEIAQESFMKALLIIEAQEVTPLGLTLTASETADHWTLFKIKMNGTNETCASFEFLPETGEFRRGCHQCNG